jgi:SAM-dependent methyltransferase
MKRARNTTHLACNGTLEILYTGSSDYVVRQVGEGGRTHEDFEDGITTDSVDLIVHFRPPLTAATSVETTLSIQYVGGKHVETPIIWRQTLQPLDKGASLILREEELEYRCYPSYNVHVKGGKILALYVSVENAMTAPTTTFDLTLQVHVNTRLEFMARQLGERGRFLAWFPPDVDPAQWGLRLDPRHIPQKTPLWFKLRGDVSGSKAYSLLGWFGGDDRLMTAFQKHAMRLGNLSEDLIILLYLHAFPNRVFEEMGWCQAPGHPIGWGASPDGVIIDAQMTWDNVPMHVASQYSKESRNTIQITRGACEFKTSRTKLTVEGYFLPQVYMEMIALQVIWCDLVRFRPSRQWDATTGAWRYNDEAHVYRIFRDPSIEARLIPLWKRAHVNQHVLKQIVCEEAFVSMRKELEQMAREQIPYRTIQVSSEDPKLETTLQEYHLYRNPKVAVMIEQQQQQQQSPWNVLAARHAELQALHPASPHFVQLIAAQIKGYAALLE